MSDLVHFFVGAGLGAFLCFLFMLDRMPRSSTGKKSPDYLKGWTDGYEVAYADARSAREDGYAKGYADGQVELAPAKPKRVKKIRKADA